MGDSRAEEIRDGVGWQNIDHVLSHEPHRALPAQPGNFCELPQDGETGKDTWAVLLLGDYSLCEGGKHFV